MGVARAFGWPPPSVPFVGSNRRPPGDCGERPDFTWTAGGALRRPWSSSIGLATRLSSSLSNGIYGLIEHVSGRCIVIFQPAATSAVPLM